MWYYAYVTYIIIIIIYNIYVATYNIYYIYIYIYIYTVLVSSFQETYIAIEVFKQIDGTVNVDDGGDPGLT